MGKGNKKRRNRRKRQTKLGQPTSPTPSQSASQSPSTKTGFHWTTKFLGLVGAATLTALIATAFTRSSDGVVAPSSTAAVESRVIPERSSRRGSFDDYGEIIFQVRPEAEKQLYVVAQQHHNFLTRQHERSTPRAQLEIYRIAEHLFKEKNVKLVLSEGRYSDEEYSVRNAEFYQASTGQLTPVEIQRMIDASDAELAGGLFAMPSYQAEHALLANYGMVIQGAEDRAAHGSVINLLRVMLQGQTESLKELNLEELMNDPNAEIPEGLAQAAAVLEQIRPAMFAFNELRSARILQNAPGVIERERRAGRIDNYRAVIVIGAGHIPEMITYLREGRAVIEGGVLPGMIFEDRTEEFDLEDYGAQIIMPHTVKPGYEMYFDTFSRHGPGHKGR